LGPLLWNTMYNGILRLPLPEGTKIIGFADDIAFVVVVKFIEEIKYIYNKSIATVRRWLDYAGTQNK